MSVASLIWTVIGVMLAFTVVVGLKWMSVQYDAHAPSFRRFVVQSAIIWIVGAIFLAVCR